jgi:integral membrane sensor domain MASE1
MLSYRVGPGVPGSSLTDRSPWWLSLSLITLAYLVAVWVGLRLVVRPEGIAIFWPASGLALGALLLVPTRRWPPLLAAWFVVHAGAELAVGLHVIPALAYPAIALAEVTLGASLIRRTTPHESLAEFDRRGLVALTGWMTLVAAPLSAVTAAAMHHQILGGDFLKVAFH